MRSMPHTLDFAQGTIDVEAGVIYDVVMVEQGPAKGHGVHLEEEFVTDLIAYDQKHHAKMGIKARFGHPGASSDTMGTQMGYFRNIRPRVKGKKMQAIADLHLLSAADVSPEKPNMRQWALQMAQEAPDFMMSSIVFKPGRYYQRTEEGEKNYVWEKVDHFGDMFPEADPALGNVYVEFGKKGEHYYTDLVEAGAATESLFGAEANPHLFVSKVQLWLADNIEIKEFIKANPERVQEFLQTLGVAPKKTLSMSIKELFFGANKPETDVTLSAAEVTELREKMTALEEKFAAIESENTALKTKVTETETALATATADVAKFKKEAETAKDDARKLHVDGAKGVETDKKDTVTELEINKRAAAIQAGRKAV